MTDRLNGCTVIFAKDIREDDAEQILNAMRCIKNVLKVTPIIADYEAYLAESRARAHFRDKLWKVIDEE